MREIHAYNSKTEEGQVLAHVEVRDNHGNKIMTVKTKEELPIDIEQDNCYLVLVYKKG